MKLDVRIDAYVLVIIRDDEPKPVLYAYGSKDGAYTHMKEIAISQHFEEDIVDMKYDMNHPKLVIRRPSDSVTSTPKLLAYVEKITL